MLNWSEENTNEKAKITYLWKKIHIKEFGVGLIFLPIIFSLILGFDNSKYTKPSINE